MLADFRSSADVVIDTTSYNVHQLSAKVDELLSTEVETPVAAGRACPSASSTAYRWTPTSSWTCGSCPTPTGTPSCGSFTGQRRAGARLRPGAGPGAQEYIAHAEALIRTSVTGYLAEGRRHVTVAVGCTGGKHRSVATAEELVRRLGDMGRRPDHELPSRPGTRVTGPRVVALGGGHGLSASLQALRHLSEHITAVVTVADDGGSSGRLRQEFDILPPGDLRMALAALVEDTSWGHQWAAVLQHRIGGSGELSGHALGNLLLMSLWELTDTPVQALDIAGRLLNIRGRVLPMSSIPLDIEASVVGVDPDDPSAPDTIRGQSDVAACPGRVLGIRLLPEDPPASSEAVEAILLADWVVLGPGSWFTSVMPHLLVPDLRRALSRPRPAGSSPSTWASTTTRPRASPRRSTSRCSAHTLPTCTSTT